MLTFRHVEEGELEAFWDALTVPFAFDRDKDDEEHLYDVFEKDRLIGAFDGETLVGTLGAFSLDMTVPGGSLPTAGTTIVSVLPTHRRRGALTGMMQVHFDEILERGEPLAALWASEAPIYGRYGYGSAADEANIDIASTRLAFPSVDETVSVRMVTLEEAVEHFPPLFEAMRVTRPGAFRRGDAWWRHRRLRDTPRFRAGATAQRLAIAERDGRPVGYVHFRSKEDWSSGHAAGTVRVLELVGSDLEAEKVLWKFVAEMDLMETVKCDRRPLDDPLVWALIDPRRLNRKISDTLWVRVMDVPAALTGRRYAQDGSIVIGLADGFRPESGGTFRLSVDGGTGLCEPTDDRPDLTMDIGFLGALMMGGRSAAEMARGGVIDGTEGSVAMIDRLFRWTPGPFCPEIF